MRGVTLTERFFYRSHIPAALHPILRGLVVGGLALGIAFEACTLLSIPLFEEDRSRLTARGDEAGRRLALLPKAARARAVKLDDDF